MARFKLSTSAVLTIVSVICWAVQYAVPEITTAWRLFLLLVCLLLGATVILFADTGRTVVPMIVRVPLTLVWFVVIGRLIYLVGLPPTVPPPPTRLATPKPTAKPTATPKPTSAPTAYPTATPYVPPPTTVPTRTPVPTSTPRPTPTPTPYVSLSGQVRATTVAIPSSAPPSTRFEVYWDVNSSVNIDIGGCQNFKKYSAPAPPPNSEMLSAVESIWETPCVPTHFTRLPNGASGYEVYDYITTDEINSVLSGTETLYFAVVIQVRHGRWRNEFKECFYLSGPTGHIAGCPVYE